MRNRFHGFIQNAALCQIRKDRFQVLDVNQPLSRVHRRALAAIMRKKKKPIINK